MIKHHNETHGNTKHKQVTPEYQTWIEIKRRCHDSTRHDYPRYGGRGIKVCYEWLISFQAFLNHVGKRPSKNHSLDRINSNRGYEPGNCRWATRKEQGRNKSNNRLITYKNQTLCLSEWCELLGIKRHVIKCRLSLGWTVEKAFETPVGSINRWTK